MHATETHAKKGWTSMNTMDRTVSLQDSTDGNFGISLTNFMLQSLS
jgi:hypothetical protein